jgi:hypothetical protein
MKLLLILKEMFYALSGAIAIFFLMEFIKPGIVIAHLNLNLLLILWLIIGIFLITLSEINKNKI